jgi:hypothetical protein
MKDYETMAESVLKRRDDYVEKRRKQVKRSISILAGVCLVVLVGGGIWHSGTRSNQDETAEGGEDVAAGGIVSGTVAGSDSTPEYEKEEMQQTAIADMGSDLDGDSVGYSAADVSEDYDGDEAGYMTTVISDFGEAKMESDISVSNGAVVFSDALTGALEQYGGDVLYRVIVELFSDGVQIDCAGDAGTAEMERFAAEGYTVAFETYNDGYVDHNYFTLHATAEQLDSSYFPASEQYGYCVMLYGERIEESDQSQEDVSVAIDAPVQDEVGNTGALMEQTRIKSNCQFKTVSCFLF